MILAIVILLLFISSFKTVGNIYFIKKMEAIFSAFYKMSLDLINSKELKFFNFI